MGDWQPKASELLPALAVRHNWKPQTDGLTIVTGFWPGHGWVVSATGAGAAVNLNDTSAPGPLADQSVSVVIGTGGASVDGTGLGLNLTGKSLVFWIRYSGFVSGNLPTFTTYAGDAGFANYWSNGTVVPQWGSIDLYAPESGWICFEWIPGQVVYGSSAAVTSGAPNIAAVDSIRLHVDGNATDPSTVFYWGGVAIKTLGSVYPNGVVSFTFDDSDNGLFPYARPTLARHNIPATAYVIADKVGVSGNPTVAQLRQMQDQAGWDIGGHAFTTAAHNKGYENLPSGQLAGELRNLRNWLLDNGFNGESYASPGGTGGQSVWTVAQQYFREMRSAGFGGNRLGPIQSAPLLQPYFLASGTWDATQGSTVAGFNTAIDNAFTEKTWLVLNFHNVITTASSGEDISTADLDAIASHASGKGIAIRTVGEVWRESGVY